MRKIAVGTIDARNPNYTLRKVAVGFEDELFLKIKALAEHTDRSFSAQVRELCRKGLEKHE